MNEQSDNRRTLNESQMDQLLSSFYKLEMPSKLDQLPSSWPQLEAAASAKKAKTAVTMVAVDAPSSGSFASDVGTYHSGSSLGSRAVVAVASLAACLAVIVASSFSKPAAEPTIPVSSNVEISAPVDDVNTTMEEIDGIELGDQKAE